MPIPYTEEQRNFWVSAFACGPPVGLRLPRTGGQTAVVGVAFTLTLPEAVQGQTPYVYTLTGLPAGLAFNATTRVVSGTPTTAGSEDVTYGVTDADSDTATSTFAILVVATRFVVEAGQSNKFWSQQGSETIGSITSGSVELLTSIEISRLWRRTTTRFRMNQNGTGSWVTFIAGNADAMLTMETPHGTVTLAFSDNTNHNASEVNFAITAAQEAILGAIVSGDAVTVTVTL